MTVGAATILQAVGQPGFMTFIAGYLDMFFFQREACLIVIKIAHSLDCREGDLTMTLPSVLAKLVLVRVFMAVYT